VEEWCVLWWKLGRTSRVGGGGKGMVCSSASYCQSSCICTQITVVTQITHGMLCQKVYRVSGPPLLLYPPNPKNTCIRWNECASAPVVSVKGANSCSPRLTRGWSRVSARPAMTMRWPAAVRTAVHLDRTAVRLERAAVHLDRASVHLDSTVVHLTVQLNRRAPSISKEKDERAGGQTSTKNLHLHCKVDVFLIVYLATCLKHYLFCIICSLYKRIYLFDCQHLQTYYHFMSIESFY
jgi:hypothetical protein